MANIHELIVRYDSTSPREGSFPIDLNCGTPGVNKKITGGIYDLSQNPPVKVDNFIDANTVMLTKIEDCNGDYVLVKNSLGYVQGLVISLCEACTTNNTQPVSGFGASCTNPMHTKDCDRLELINKLELQLLKLNDIYGAVDGLELTTENIKIDQTNISSLGPDELNEECKSLFSVFFSNNKEL